MDILPSRLIYANYYTAAPRRKEHATRQEECNARRVIDEDEPEMKVRIIYTVYHLSY